MHHSRSSRDIPISSLSICNILCSRSPRHQQRSPPYPCNTTHQSMTCPPSPLSPLNQHDVQIDFFGKTLASASSDRCIRLFEIIKNSHQLLATLEGHTGPVWKLSWAHPSHGCMLASCGYDCRVIVWRRNMHNQWNILFQDAFPSSVNTVQFSPSTDSSSPLELIAGCSDGSIRVYTYSSYDPLGIYSKIQFISPLRFCGGK